MHVNPYSGTPKTPIRNRRGDIHPPSTLRLLTPEERQQNNRPSRRDLLTSSEPDLAYPSSGPDLTVQHAPTENPDEPSKVIWGSNVSVAESMQNFLDFLRNFKVKYRVQHDRINKVENPTQVSRENEDRTLYRDYLRTMRMTSQTTLNLDVVNLLAYPNTRKLYSQLAKYPQEMVPIMDQVLRECMFEFAQEDHADEQLTGDALQMAHDEVADMGSRVHTVRAFGFEPINMRQLNPTGKSSSLSTRISSR